MYKLKNGIVYDVEIEKCSAVVYHGEITYLTHEERVNIIRGGGSDFDIVPRNFAGPPYKMVEVLTRAVRSEIFIKEWDDTIAKVIVSDRCDPTEKVIQYNDGIKHIISNEYLNSIALTSRA